MKNLFTTAEPHYNAILRAVDADGNGNTSHIKSMQASRFNLVRSLRSFDVIPRPPDLQRYPLY